MDYNELAYLPLTDLAARFARRELSPVEVTRALLDRIERLEPTLNAYVTVMADAALAEARQAEAEIGQGRHRGPLHGAPLAIKDLFWTRGVRTTAGSRALADFVPAEDAPAVDRLRAAGAVILGKTNMPEFAWGPMNEYAYGVTFNPWARDRFPGGSSMGSGAALAAGLAYGALGSDTGGSIRHPATWSGVTGLKPTYGRVSLRGVVPLAISLDHAGPMARSALDCAVLLDAIAGHDPADPTSLDAPAPRSARRLAEPGQPGRLGVVRELFAGSDPDVVAAVDAAIGRFRELGWQVEEVAVPGVGAATSANHVVLRAEAAADYGRLLAERPEALLPEFREKVRVGLAVTAAELIAAQRVGRDLRAALGVAFQRFDVLATPTRQGTAPRIDATGRMLDEVAGTSPCAPFNLAGVPALSVPCGFDSRGLPIGLQLVGPHLGDETVLAAGHTYQQATDWHQRRPAL